MTELRDLPTDALLAAYRARTLSPVDIVEDALARIETDAAPYVPFVAVTAEAARAAARASEARWKAGAPQGPLDGVPVTIKDNIALEGLPTLKGSAVTPTTPEPADAPAVARLKAAGAVILGKTTMPEFGWKGLSDSPLTGLTRNPWNPAHTTGGSSAGAAVCALLKIGRMHLGTDGAGSVRIPAAFTGVPGLKPTYGRVPAHPISVMGELAHLGPLAPTVRECGAMVAVMEGTHANDLTGRRYAPLDPAAWECGVKGLRIAWSRTLGFVTRLDPEVAALAEAAARRFEALGAHVEAADPFDADPVETLDVLWTSGAALALAPFDAATRARMDPGLVGCAEEGGRIAASTYVEHLLYRRGALAARIAAFFARFDLLLTPQMPTAALPFGADVPPPGFGGVADWGTRWTNWSPYTYPFNITQNPALSVPCGLTRRRMPAGLQIVGPLGADDRVVAAGIAHEAASA